MFAAGAPSEITIIARRPDFVGACKPPGVETVSETGGDDFLAAVKRFLGCRTLWPVHRLDRDTTGVQLFALTAAAERGLARLFRERRMEKRYDALCLGAPPNRSGTVNRSLSEWSGGRRPVRVVKGGGGLPASTSYALVAESAERGEEYRLGLMEFFPHQGRTHQIRVHAAALGYPVLGDSRYGDRAANRWAKARFGLRRQALHARELSFAWRGEMVKLECAMPDDMRLILSSVFADRRWESARAWS